MDILELKDIEQVAGDWSWKGAVIGGGAGFGGGSFGGPIGAGIVVCRLGERWTDKSSYGGASGSW